MRNPLDYLPIYDPGKLYACKFVHPENYTRRRVLKLATHMFPWQKNAENIWGDLWNVSDTAPCSLPVKIDITDGEPTFRDENFGTEIELVVKGLSDYVTEDLEMELPSGRISKKYIGDIEDRMMKREDL